MFIKIKKFIINYFISYFSMVSIASIYYWVIEVYFRNYKGDSSVGGTLSMYKLELLLFIFLNFIFIIVVYAYSYFEKRLLSNNFILIICSIFSISLFQLLDKYITSLSTSFPLPPLLLFLSLYLFYVGIFVLVLKLLSWIMKRNRKA